MKAIFNLFVLMILIFSVSCKKDSGSPAPTPASSSNAVDVYVAGSITPASKSIASFWKNGVRIDLTDGTKNAQANAIFVLGSDVYVAGYEVNASNKNVAKIWKNGVASSLPDGTQNAYARSVYVSGSDVYVAGYESNGIKTVAKVWKNGVATSLSDGTNYAYAYAVYVNGSDVYVAGEDNSNAVYWKNGTPTSLTDGITTSGRATSIQVKNSNVYASGISTTDGTVGKLTVWLNTQASYMPMGSWKRAYDFAGGACAKSSGLENVSGSLLLLNNQVVVADTVQSLFGYDNFLSVWKNTSRTIYHDQNEIYPCVLSFYVFNNDIYVVGYASESNSGSHILYWKNGELSYLEEGSTAFATSIFVKSR